MKYKLVAALVAGTAFITNVSSVLAGSDASLFKINGEIVQSERVTCDVDVDGNITMPSVDMDSFGDSVGATSTTTDINVIISGCPEYLTRASVTIEGNADSQNPELLQIPRPGPDSSLYAFGFGLEFLVDGSPLAVKKPSPEFTVKNGIIDIPLGVRYKATFNKQGRFAGKVSVPGQILVNYL